MDPGAADWFIAPDDMGYEDMIYIQGTYVDPADSTSTYDYQFILRPWGTDWSDFAADYPDGLPYYYEDWYLPATRAGISMPDAIGGGSFSAPVEVPDGQSRRSPGTQTGTPTFPWTVPQRQSGSSMMREMERSLTSRSLSPRRMRTGATRFRTIRRNPSSMPSRIRGSST